MCCSLRAEPTATIIDAAVSRQATEMSGLDESKVDRQSPYESGGHEIRTRNPLRGICIPNRPLAIRLPSESSFQMQLSVAKPVARVALVQVAKSRNSESARALIEQFGAANQLDEVLVRLESAQLLRELFHRLG